MSFSKLCFTIKKVYIAEQVKACADIGDMINLNIKIKISTIPPIVPINLRTLSIKLNSYFKVLLS